MAAALTLGVAAARPGDAQAKSAARCPSSGHGIVAQDGSSRVVVRRLPTRWGKQHTLFVCVLGGRLHRLGPALYDRRGEAQFPRRLPTYAFGTTPPLAALLGRYYGYLLRRDYSPDAREVSDAYAGYGVVLVDVRTGRRVFSTPISKDNGLFGDVAVTGSGGIVWTRLNSGRWLHAASSTGMSVLDSTRTGTADFDPGSVMVVDRGDVVQWSRGGVVQTAVVHGPARG